MDIPKHIFVVDDEADLVKLVTYNLKKEGFLVDSAQDGEKVLAKVKKGKYDLIILDLMLPGLQGMELCRIIRNDPKTSSLPIIMLTAKGEEVDRVLGLELGADDYITKPFSPRELVARVKAVLRRTIEKPAADKIIEAGDLVINKETYSVTNKGLPVKLSATEFKLLLFLAERRGKIFNRDQILDAIWRDEAFVEPRTVDVHIRRLRSQIEEDPAQPRYIKTMRGIGYFFDGK
ncbi:MAG TPA: response regulator [Thermodesulfovibrionales bacterium]|nr:response regulator [Thermodesulfovibrionales bacterium]